MLVRCTLHVSEYCGCGYQQQLSYGAHQQGPSISRYAAPSVFATATAASATFQRKRGTGAAAAAGHAAGSAPAAATATTAAADPAATAAAAAGIATTVSMQQGATATPAAGTVALQGAMVTAAGPASGCGRQSRQLTGAGQLGAACTTGWAHNPPGITLLPSPMLLLVVVQPRLALGRAVGVRGVRHARRLARRLPLLLQGSLGCGAVYCRSLLASQPGRGPAKSGGTGRALLPVCAVLPVCGCFDTGMQRTCV